MGLWNCTKVPSLENFEKWEKTYIELVNDGKSSRTLTVRRHKLEIPRDYLESSNYPLPVCLSSSAYGPFWVSFTGLCTIIAVWLFEAVDQSIDRVINWPRIKRPSLAKTQTEPLSHRNIYISKGTVYPVHASSDLL